MNETRLVIYEYKSVHIMHLFMKKTKIDQVVEYLPVQTYILGLFPNGFQCRFLFEP